MGVKYMWDILKPTSMPCKLEELRGKTLSVDFGIWIMQAKFAGKKMNIKSSKLCLRTIFYRTFKLLQLGILPVCVTDGDAPEIKSEIILSRLKREYAELPKRVGISRSVYNIVKTECVILMGSLGIPCIRSSGEGEAMCALLNKSNMVDGCLTEDGDCFLYGARQIYRKVSYTHNEACCYKMDDIENHLGLNREKLVVLALLLGCDYQPQGLPHVGPRLAQKFLRNKRHDSLLQRLQNWMKPGNEDYERFSQLRKAHGETPSKTEVLSMCSECAKCKNENGSTKSPNELKCDCSYRDIYSNLTEDDLVDFKIWKNALSIANFPSQKIIDEYLKERDILPTEKFIWSKPNIRSFMRFAKEKIGWSFEKSYAQVLPLITKWQLIQKDNGATTDDFDLEPIKVIKLIKRKKIQCIQVLWDTKTIIHDIQTEFGDKCIPNTNSTTTEELNLFQRVYPELHADFLKRAQTTKRRAKRQKRELKDESSEFSDSADYSEFSDSKNSSEHSESENNDGLPNDYTSSTFNRQKLRPVKWNLRSRSNTKK